MANRRMISKSISISEQVNDLSDFAALLFSWMIPHADDWGILPGSPKKIKALITPMRKQTPKEIEKAIREMVAVELIWWYKVEGTLYIQFRTWDKHQDGLHKRTKPKNPPYPGTSGKIPENPGQENRTEENLTEEKRKENIKDIVPHSEIIDHLNAVCGTEYKHTTKATRELINGRWSEGYRLDDFKKVINNKAKDWLNNPDMSRYLRPSTLFAPKKFEEYLNQKGGQNRGRADPSITEIENRIAKTQQEFGHLFAK